MRKEKKFTAITQQHIIIKSGVSVESEKEINLFKVLLNRFVETMKKLNNKNN